MCLNFCDFLDGAVHGEITEPVEVLIGKALDRPVRINDSIVVSTSLSPCFTLKGLQIENPEGFSTEDFLSMDLANIQIELLPLLKRKVHIAEIKIQGLGITLEETKEGRVNWAFGSSDVTDKDPASPAVPAPASCSGSGKPTLHSDTFVIKKPDLQTIHVEFHTPENNGPARFDIDNCQGDMVPGQPLALDIEGKILEFNYTVDVSIASLKPGTEKSDAALKVVMQNFDISILVHRTKPDSEMGGMVNLDIDLQSSASSIDELLATGTVISIFQPRHSS